MHSVICNDIAKHIWEFAQNSGFWSSSSLIPAAESIMADKMLRVFNDNREWMLSHKLFKILCDKFQFTPQVDHRFATRLNKQIDKYVSWMPNPYWIAVNAFNFSWKTHKIYVFPPFSLVGAAISKSVDNTVLVSNNALPPDRSPHSVPFRFKNAFPTIQTVESSPTVSKASIFSSHPIGHSLAQFSFPWEIEEVILAAWKPKTAVKYKSFIDRWKRFCIQGSENCYTPSMNSVLKFLYYLYKNGCYYTGLSSACSALSTIMLIEGYSKLSDHPLISKFMKGIYSQHPTLPCYANIWEIIYCWLILSPKQKILTWLWNVWQKS